MRFQARPGFCGPAAIVNAFRALGRKLAEPPIGAACECTENEGSTPEKLVEAIRSFGFGATKFETVDKKAAWGWLTTCLREGKPVILLVLNWGHYVTATGILGNRVNIVDSTNEKYNKVENGIHVFGKREFMKKWLHTKDGAYFGIAITPK